MKLIVDISDELHSKLKHKAIDDDVTLRELVEKTLEKIVK
jgi:predicted HicB family RNase H-like nuclease